MLTSLIGDEGGGVAHTGSVTWGGDLSGWVRDPILWGAELCGPVMWIVGIPLSVGLPLNDFHRFSHESWSRVGRSGQGGNREMGTSVHAQKCFYLWLIAALRQGN